MNYKDQTKQKVSIKTIDGQKVNMIEKNLTISGFKVLDEEKGIFEAHCSVFGNVDSYGEIVDKGAFLKWLAQYFDNGVKRFPKCVWAHNWEEPIAATLECREDEFGLYVKGQFVLEVQRAREVYALMKAGVITDFSFGFSVLDYRIDESTQLIHLTEIAIYEWSPVLVGANRDATLIGVKSGKKDGEGEGDGAENGDGGEAAKTGADDPAPSEESPKEGEDPEKPEAGNGEGGEQDPEKDPDEGGAEDGGSSSEATTETEDQKAARLEKRSEAVDTALDALKALTSALEAIKATEDGSTAKDPDTSKKVDKREGKGEAGQTKVLKAILRDARKADKIIESVIVRAKQIKS